MKLWGGRFEGEPDRGIEAFTSSLAFDQRMAEQDVRGSIAHCRMLAHTGILPAEDAGRIEAGLREILEEVERGERLTGAEDIHSWVESRLREKIGPVGGKLHTARSRNDQVATDARLYLREAIGEIGGLLAMLQSTLIRRAEEELDAEDGPTVLPGYTHLQHAQPILLSHHLLAYFW